MCKLIVHHTSCSDYDHIVLDLLHISISKKVFSLSLRIRGLKSLTFVKRCQKIWLKIHPIYLLPKFLSVSSFMAKRDCNFFHKF